MLEKLDKQSLEDLFQDNRTLTGFADLDELTRCFRAGSLVFLASRPSMGKTSLALNIAANVLFEPRFSFEDSSSIPKLRRAVAYFSLQLPKEQVIQRISAMLGRVPIHGLGSGMVVTAKDRDQLVRSVAEVSQVPLFVYDPMRISLTEMEEALMKAQSRLATTGADLGLVIVDYFQLMRLPAQGKGLSREDQTRKLLRELKHLARRLNVPILVLARLDSPLERRHNKRPRFIDFKSYEPVEEYADTAYRCEPKASDKQKRSRP